LLAAAAAGTVVMMANHPSDAHAAGVGAVVHGSMILLLLVMAYGFFQFAILRGISRGLVSAGLIAFAVSVFGHIVAATINGFVVPLLVDPAAPVSHDILRFAWYANQAFAKLAIVSGGAAYVLWGIDLVRAGSSIDRWLGGLGAAIGAVLIVGIMGALVPLNVGGALLLYGLQGLWAALVGVQMARGRLYRSGNAATVS
jgi:hypothetical protein